MQRLGLVLISLFMLGSLLFAPMASHAGRLLFTNNSPNKCYRLWLICSVLGLDFSHYHLTRPRTNYIFDDVVGTIEWISYARSPERNCNDAGKDDYYIAWRREGGAVSATRSFRVTVDRDDKVSVEITRE